MIGNRSPGIGSKKMHRKPLPPRRLILPLPTISATTQIIPGTLSTFRLTPKAIREDQIENALCSLATVELVYRYNVHGKPFVSLSGWERNQSIRAKIANILHPKMRMNAGIYRTLKTLACKCMQMKSNVPVIQSNPNPIREAERAREAAARPAFDNSNSPPEALRPSGGD